MQLVQLIVSGLANGCIYGILALGFVLIYKATEAINLAQGDLMMLGAFVAIGLGNDFGLGLPLAIPVAILAMGAFGYGLDMLVIRRMAGESQMAIVIVTIAIGFVLRFAAGVIWGYEPQALETAHAGKDVTIAGIVLGLDELFVMGATIGLTLLFWRFFNATRIGIAMQATSQNHLAACYMGISVRRMQSLAWGLAGAMAAVAGVLYASRGAIDPSSGLLGIKAFAAAVIGGLGSLPGALVGGLVVGVIEPFAARYAPPGFSQMAPYLLLFLILVFRPEGILVQTRRKKV